MRAEAFGVVVFLDVDDFFGGDDGVDGHVVIAAVLEDDEAAVDLPENEVECEIAEGHGGDGVDGVGFTAADEVTELLVDNVDFLAVVEFGGKFGELVGDEQLGEPLDIELVLGNDAAISGAGHGGKHGGKAGVAAKDFKDHEAFVGTGGSAEAIGQVDGAGDAGAEADAVIGAGNVVVHRLGNPDDFDAFLKQADGVAEGVVAADGNEVIDAEPSKVLEDIGSEVVLVGGIGVFKVSRNAGLADAAGIGARRVQKGAAGATGAVDDFFGEHQEVVGVVVVLIADHFDEAGPAVTNADDFVAFAKSAKGDGADGRVEAGDVAAAGEDADDAFLDVDISHDCRINLSERTEP